MLVENGNRYLMGAMADNILRCSSTSNTNPVRCPRLHFLLDTDPQELASTQSNIYRVLADDNDQIS